MDRIRIPTLATLLAALLLVVAACGGDEPAAAPTTTVMADDDMTEDDMADDMAEDDMSDDDMADDDMADDDMADDDMADDMMTPEIMSAGELSPGSAEMALDDGTVYMLDIPAGCEATEGSVLFTAVDGDFEVTVDVMGMAGSVTITGMMAAAGVVEEATVGDDGEVSAYGHLDADAGEAAFHIEARCPAG